MIVTTVRADGSSEAREVEQIVEHGLLLLDRADAESLTDDLDGTWLKLGADDRASLWQRQ